MIYSMQSKDGTQSLKAEATKETRDAVLANFAEQVNCSIPSQSAAESNTTITTSSSMLRTRSMLRTAPGRRIGNIAKRREQHPVFNPAAAV